MTKKRLAIYQKLGIEPPKPVKCDRLSVAIVEFFYLVARGRRYTNGVALPISVRDISDVWEVYPLAMPRQLLNEILFEIDDLERK